MAEGLFIRTADGLAPADEEAAELLERIKCGTLVKGNITKSRNLGFHRKFMKMVRTVFNNQDRYDQFNVFLNGVVKLITGHVDVVTRTIDEQVEVSVPWGTVAPPSVVERRPGGRWKITPLDGGKSMYEWVTLVPVKKVVSAFVPRSISFATMEQLEFEEFYYSTLDALIKRCEMENRSAESIAAEVDRLVGFA